MTGPSGSGKTSLLRTLAGLWSAGKGKITFYVEDEEEHQPSNSSGVAPLDTADDKNGELERPLNYDQEKDRPSNRNYKGIFFLPQRPYMVLGTLRQQLLYPTWANDAIPTSDTTKPTGMHLYPFCQVYIMCFKF